MTKIISSDFLLAENPLIDDGRVFVIHSRKLPVIIAEAFHFDMDQEAEWMEAKRQFDSGASVDYPGELIFLGARFISGYPAEWKGLSNQEISNRLAKIMSRMGDWYFSYLKFEDQNIKKNL